MASICPGVFCADEADYLVDDYFRSLTIHWVQVSHHVGQGGEHSPDLLGHHAGSKVLSLRYDIYSVS